MRLEELRQQCLSSINNDPRWEEYRDALEGWDNIQAATETHKGWVSIGQTSDLDSKSSARLDKILKLFIPWKKGPFNIFGRAIDAEWRSDYKWDRLEGFIDLQGQTVADIGCHNGYFMFRMAEQSPAKVIGFEPYAKLFYVFSFLQGFARLPNLVFEPFGLEWLDLYPGVFDTIFCLGILYHRRDPLATLEKIYRSLKKGGQVIIDCQGVNLPGSWALFPKSRYGTAKGFWFLPTLECLENYLHRSGFRKIECLYKGALSIGEQRQTPWAPHPSLESFLTDDLSETVEGYPPPWRFYMRAYR